MKIMTWKNFDGIYNTDSDYRNPIRDWAIGLCRHSCFQRFAWPRSAKVKLSEAFCPTCGAKLYQTTTVAKGRFIFLSLGEVGSLRATYRRTWDVSVRRKDEGGTVNRWERLGRFDGTDVFDARKKVERVIESYNGLPLEDFEIELRVIRALTVLDEEVGS